MSITLACILFSICWTTIAVLYAHHLYELPIYQTILKTKNWDTDPEVRKMVNDYGLVKLIIDMIMILPIIILILPFK
jgi:hypothetical protein